MAGGLVCEDPHSRLGPGAGDSRGTESGLNGLSRNERFPGKQGSEPSVSGSVQTERPPACGAADTLVSAPGGWLSLRLPWLLPKLRGRLRRPRVPHGAGCRRRRVPGSRTAGRRAVGMPPGALGLATRAGHAEPTERAAPCPRGQAVRCECFGGGRCREGRGWRSAEEEASVSAAQGRGRVAEVGSCGRWNREKRQKTPRGFG